MTADRPPVSGEPRRDDIIEAAADAHVGWYLWEMESKGKSEHHKEWGLCEKPICRERLAWCGPPVSGEPRCACSGTTVCPKHTGYLSPEPHISDVARVVDANRMRWLFDNYGFGAGRECEPPDDDQLVDFIEDLRQDFRSEFGTTSENSQARDLLEACHERNIHSRGDMEYAFQPWALNKERLAEAIFNVTTTRAHAEHDSDECNTCRWFRSLSNEVAEDAAAEYAYHIVESA